MTFEPTSPSVTVDVFVGGTPKSATTTVFNALAAHPGVLGSSNKEPHFFLQTENSNPYGEFLSAEAYSGLFGQRDPIQLAAEGSTWYFHNAKTVAPRIKQHNPDAKLIFVFRNPVDRCQSDYAYHLWRGNISPNQTLADLATDRAHWIHDANRYTENLAVWREHFPEHQILLLLTDEVRSDFGSVLNRIEVFLGLPPFPSQGTGSRQDNVTRYPRSTMLLRTAAPALKVAEKLLPQNVYLGARNKVFFTDQKPQNDGDTVSRLRETYRNEITGFAKALGRDLSDWL